MRLVGPRPCPDCDNGKTPSGEMCRTCYGSGRVYLQAALRPVDPEVKKKFEAAMNRALGQIADRSDPPGFSTQPERP